MTGMSITPLADDVEAVKDELSRVVSSSAFDASDRNRKFLRYVVEETLAGRADRIKAYSIATSVFGRDESFDPQLDSIVRIEAGRLRRSLERYYLTSGNLNPIRIVIPRGTYVPQFLTGADAPQVTGSAGPSPKHTDPRPRKPVILVLDFADESTPPLPFLSSGIARQILVGLTRFPSLSVFGQSSLQVAHLDHDLGHIRSQLGVDYFVVGFLFHAEDRLHLDVMLVDAHSGRNIWADTFDRPCGPPELLSMRDEIASNVVRTLALPWGVIFSSIAAGSQLKVPEDLDSFDAIVRYHQYAATFDPSLYPRARIAAERAVEIDREFGEAWACLSMLQTEVVRFGYQFDGDPPPSVIIERAIQNARRAISLSPNSSQGFLALGKAVWFKGDVEGCLGALSTAIQINPNDAVALAELGLRLCMRMVWDKGVARIEEAYDRHPALPPNFRVGIALWHYAHGRMREARDEIGRTNAPGNLYRHVMMAVTALAFGDTGEMKSAIDGILAHDPDYGSRVEADLRLRCMHPDLIEKLLKDLRAAGLPGAPRAIAATRSSSKGQRSD